MPDLAAHHLFGSDVWSSLDDAVTSRLDRAVFEAALDGPDFWALGGLTDPFLFRRVHGRSRVMHSRKTGTFLTALMLESIGCPLLFSYFCGFICHYVSDKTCHPSIAAYAECDGRPGSHTALEREMDLRLPLLRGEKPFDRSVSSLFYPTAVLPEAIRAPLDRCYFSVYGWHNASADFNCCMRGGRLYYRITERPRRLPRFVRRMEGFSAHFPSDGRFSAACLQSNEKACPTAGPMLPLDYFTGEQYRSMVRQAVEIIQSAYDVVYSGAAPDAAAALIGNDSYLTGMPVSE